MKIEPYRWLAGVIAAHPSREVVGRTRLQKTVRLLQRVGLPTHYDYQLFFYGPYSHGLHSEVAVLKSMGLATEIERTSQEHGVYYIVRAAEDAALPAIEAFRPQIDLIAAEQDAVVLELAATYDAFRELGYDHDDALKHLRRKKRSKCTPERERAAFRLLKKLGLPT